MIYRVDLMARAIRDPRHIHRDIDAAVSGRARRWFLGFETAILDLDATPGRSPVTPEEPRLCYLLCGRGTHVYRIIYMIDGPERVVTVLHIRHGARRKLPAKTTAMKNPP